MNSIGTAQSPSRETTNGHGVSLSQPLRVACSCHAGSSPGLLATQQSDRRARHHHHIPHPRRVTSRASKRVDEERRSTRSSLSSSGAHISRTKRINQSTLSAAASDDISSGERPRAYLEKVCAARHLSPRCFHFLPSHPDSSLLPSCARQRTRSPKVLPQKGRKSLPRWFAHTIRLTRATATAQDRRGGCRAQVLAGEVPASWLAPVLGLDSFD